MWAALMSAKVQVAGRQEDGTATPLPTARPKRFSLPVEPGRRTATWSLLMVPGTAVALLAAAAMGTFLQVAVFDLEEQESIGRAGARGYIAGLFLLALMTLPALAGIILGIRARRLGEGRRGTTGLVVNVLVVAYLVIPGIVFVLFG